MLQHFNTTAYVINVCERMLIYARIRSQKLIYVRDTLGIRRVRSEYADIRLCVVLYAETNIFLGHAQNLSAYASV